MPATAYVARILDQLAVHGPPPGVEAETFGAFVRSVGRQLRAPYQTRFGAAEVIAHLTDLFNTVAVRKDDEIAVYASMEDGSGVFVTNMADQPFVVDTLLLVLRRRNAEYLGGFNVVVPVQRAADGRISGVGRPTDRQESIVRAEVDGIDEADLPAVAVELRQALTLSRAIVSDFGNMT